MLAYEEGDRPTMQEVCVTLTQLEQLAEHPQTQLVHVTDSYIRLPDI